MYHGGHLLDSAESMRVEVKVVLFWHVFLMLTLGRLPCEMHQLGGRAESKADHSIPPTGALRPQWRTPPLSPCTDKHQSHFLHKRKKKSYKIINEFMNYWFPKLNFQHCVTWSFTTHSIMLIWCSVIISYYWCSIVDN